MRGAYLGPKCTALADPRGQWRPFEAFEESWQTRAMEWSPNRNALRGRVAVVAGATRGAGRGIAAALGEAGATVVCTGRSTRSTRSDYNRAETIEETAEVVTRLGGTGIAAAVDHLDPGQVKTLAEQIRTNHGHIDVLVNDIWGGELLKGGPAEWNTPIWKHDPDKGLRILRLAIDTHLNFGVSEENWRDALGRTSADDDQPAAPADFALSESPRYVGRAIVALASDPDRTRWNKKSVSSGELAREYGFTDLDGSQPDIWRYIEEIRDRGLQANRNDYR